jgi:RHS repeat-associated protein
MTSGNPPAPEGNQVAFIQNDGSLWKTATVAAGTYTLSFKAAQRSGNETYQQLRVNLRPSPGPTSVKTFVWSGNTIAEERDSTGANVTKRFFAEGEQRIGGTDAGKYYYTRDHLGSVREVSDSGGLLKGQYDYDAWGNSVVVKGKMQVNFGYTGHYFHQPSGLNLAMYRAYHPTLGRWISRDPLNDAELLQGPNLYAYVRNNPLSLVDPLGLCRQKNESFYGCLDRYARDFYGEGLTWSDNLGYYGLASAGLGAGASALSSLAQRSAQNAIDDASLAGVRAGGPMLERQAAAAQAARTAGRLTISTGVLAFVSKASAVIGTAATAFSAGARAAFINDCTSECVDCK